MSEQVARSGPIASVSRTSVLRYLLIGGSSFVLDFGLLFLLHEALSVPLWLATAVAFLASFAFNYLLQRAFSFTSNSAHGPALIKYTLLVLFNTVAISLIVSGFDFLGASWEVGKIIATALTTLWNYFFYRFWIFPANKKDPPSGAI